MIATCTNCGEAATLAPRPIHATTRELGELKLTTERLDTPSVRVVAIASGSPLPRERAPHGWPRVPNRRRGDIWRPLQHRTADNALAV